VVTSAAEVAAFGVVVCDVVAGGVVATDPSVDVLTAARRLRAAAARSLRWRSIVARLARVTTVGVALVVFAAVDAMGESAGDATLATTFVTAGTLTGGTATFGVATRGVATAGAVTGGVDTDGVVTAGVVATGVVTAGTVTAGTVTVGTVAAGTVTVGTVTAGTVTTGVVIPGVVRLPSGPPVPTSPFACADPANAPSTSIDANPTWIRTFP
jgi:hypothetical protein